MNATQDSLQHVFFISAELSHLDGIENLRRTLRMKVILEESGVRHVQVQGRYAGHNEDSFMIVGSPHMAAALAKDFEQESILKLSQRDRPYAGAAGVGTIIYLDGTGRTDKLGTMHLTKVMPSDESGKGYTYLPHLSLYLVAGA